MIMPVIMGPAAHILADAGLPLAPLLSVAELVPWGVALVVAAATGCVIYFQRVAGKRARAEVQQELTERIRTEEGLRYRAAFERLMLNLAARFIGLAPAEVDEGVNQGLAAIGGFTGVDRGYVFLFSAQGAAMDNTHEWCAEGVAPQIANSQDVPSEGVPWGMAKLRRSETIHIPSVSALPSEAGAEREILERQGIRSLLVVPMTLGGELVGFLGFDSIREVKTWSEDDIALLGILGEIIVNALERADIVWTTW